MAQHRYLREYDEDFDRGQARERSWSRPEPRERDPDWRERSERNREFMFRERHGGMSHYGPEHGHGGFQGDYQGGREQGGFGGYGDYSRGRTSFTAHPDEHYLSWRDQHMREIDRDYDEY